MITHSIRVHKELVLREPKKGSKEWGAEKHKAIIFYKLRKRWKDGGWPIEPGSFVHIKGTRRMGQVFNAVDRLDVAEWDGLKCRFVEVYFDDVVNKNDYDEMFKLYHPDDLKVITNTETLQ